MKKIPKKLLDALIHMERLYWKEDNKDFLTAGFALAMEIEEKTGVMWSAVHGFVSSIIQHSGLSPEASNEKIYEALKLFGWEIADENQTSESL